MAIITKDRTIYQVKLNPESHTEAVFKLGGDTLDKFVPNINISKWDDEFFINLNAKDTVVTNEIETLNENKLSTTIGSETHEMWPLENERCLEYQITFAFRPANIFVLDVLCSQDLTWHYQRALTPEEIAAGRERPENVIDSYAVYCSQRNNKYRSGKFAHVFRWQLTDALGQQEWAEQEVKFSPNPTVDGHRIGTLTISLPQQWMEDATYPVKLMGAGDTFGIEAQGATDDQSSENTIRGCAASPAGDGTTTQISVYIRETITNGAHDGKCALYDESDDSLVGGSAELSGQFLTTAAWYDFSITQAILAAETYAIVFCGSSGAGSIRMYYDDQAGEGRVGDPGNDDYDLLWPDPVTFTGDPDGRRYSIHCDYTPTAAGITVNCTLGTLTIVGINPSLSVGTDIDSTLGAVTIAGLNTEVSQGIDINCTLGEISIAGLNPSISVGVGIDATLGQINIVGLGVNISEGIDIDSTLGSVSISGLNADVQTGTVINCTSGNINIDGQNPAISVGTDIETGLGTVNIVGFDANIDLGVTIDVSVGDVVVAGQNADVEAGTTIDCAKGDVNIAGLNADISLPTNIDCTKGNIVVSSLNPDIISTVLVGVTLGQIDISGLVASVVVGELVSSPAKRTFIIPIENRTLTVEAENRTLAIEQENRTLII